MSSLITLLPSPGIYDKICYSCTNFILRYNINGKSTVICKNEEYSQVVYNKVDDAVDRLILDINKYMENRYKQYCQYYINGHNTPLLNLYLIWNKGICI